MPPGFSTEREQYQQQTLLHPDEIDTLIADYRDGMSVRELSASYKIHRTPAPRARWRSTTTNASALTLEDLIKARDRRNLGDSYAAIARQFGVHAETIRRALSRP